MKKLLLFVCLVYSLNTLFSQNGYIEGYIIKANNDTIYGRIKDRYQMLLETNYYNKIRFIDKNNVKTKYSPDDIIRYSKSGLVQYLSLRDGNSSIFIEIIEDGQIILGMKIVKNHTMYVNPNGGTMVSPAYDKEVYYLVKNNTNSFWVTKFNFKKEMTEYFSDYPELSKLISSKALGYSDINTIVRMYNTWYKTDK